MELSHQHEVAKLITLVSVNALILVYYSYSIFLPFSVLY